MPDTKRTSRLREYDRKRDFSKTPEPSGTGPAGPGEGGPRFVIQKHDASHLHYDLRLEMEGVMRSWAVPKGPSLDPATKRLAMEVEDHPIAYNDFEGTIPAGEYGGGTVMLWDRGSYRPDDRRKGESEEKAILRGYRAGRLSITFEGERLRGSFALVRTDTVKGGVRSKWLLIKHSDDDADPDTDITEDVTTSVASGRTMDEIAAGEGGARVWRSNRGAAGGETQGGNGRKRASLDLSAFKPMLATAGSSVPGPAGEWTFEPKYDGIRILAYATPSTAALVTRNGHDKAQQFPEVVEALRTLSSSIGEPVVLDGEIVPLEGGKVGRFERLQGRMHVRDRGRIRALAEESPAGLAVFDILLRGERVLADLPWSERREALEETLVDDEAAGLILAPTTGDHPALLAQANREGWEGLIAKRVDAPYRPGRRSGDWLKLKLENRQELVVGGWTEPRKSRSFLGAILLGYYDEGGDFVYAGHTGTGFSHDQLESMYRRLKRLERKTPPFSETPKTNEKAHWTTPRIVVEVRFNEWTKEGKLRQPVFLGVRDDKDPKEVAREASAAGGGALRPKRKARDDGSGGDPKPSGAAKPGARKASGATAAKTRGGGGGGRGAAGGSSSARATPVDLDSAVARRLREMQGKGEEGVVELGRDRSISVTSLTKVFYPSTGHTKGDLLAYYAEMSELILPWMADRPLVLKRFPNGVEGEAFYQQAAPDNPPDGVRVETLRIEGKRQRRLVGGNLETLLYTVQLGAISFDPWHSRIGDLESADYTILDLDPGPGVTFKKVVQVARWVREEMEEMGLHGALKTSGSTGLHIYLPLPERTPLDAATLIAQIVATRVAQKHPKQATVERMTKKRPTGTVYVDYLQNILGKTVAGVYAARAKDRPTVSTPLGWDELTDDLDLREFTIETVPVRVRAIGDLWSPAMKEPNSLEALQPTST